MGNSQPKTQICIGNTCIDEQMLKRLSSPEQICIGNTCIDEQMLKRLSSPAFTTDVIGVGTATIKAESFSPTPNTIGSYRLRVRRSDGNYAWRYNGIVDIENGSFKSLSPIDKNLIDVSIKDKALVLDVINNSYPDKWILTLV
jgi:hypothetical protein